MKFVTEWRLRKHEKSLTNKVQIYCKYSKRNIHCPFEELGCKFGHDISESGDDKDRVVVDKKVEVDRVIKHDTRRKNYSSITTDISTPKETLPCEECLDNSECVDCFVNHMLGRDGKTRELFF